MRSGSKGWTSCIFMNAIYSHSIRIKIFPDEEINVCNQSNNAECFIVVEEIREAMDSIISHPATQ